MTVAQLGWVTTDFFSFFSDLDFHTFCKDSCASLFCLCCCFPFLTSFALTFFSSQVFGRWGEKSFRQWKAVREGSKKNRAQLFSPTCSE